MRLLIGIVALALVAIVLLSVLSTALHFLLSPWLLLVAVAAVAFVKFRPGRSRR